MNNKLTSIIAELPEEEDNTNSYRTPKGSFNRSMAIDKDSNEVLSKTEYRPSLPMQNHSIDQLNVHSARVNKVIKKVFDDNLFKSMANINMHCILGYTKDGKKHSFLDEYEEEK